MSIRVEVGLLSGRRVTVDADLNEEVGTLKRRAQIALGVGRGRLVGLIQKRSGCIFTDQACTAPER